MYKQLKMYGDMVRLVKQHFSQHLDATHLQLAKVFVHTPRHTCIHTSIAHAMRHSCEQHLQLAKVSDHAVRHTCIPV